MARYRGRHRAPSTAGRTAARIVAAAAVTTGPLTLTGTASAEMPENVRQAIISCESAGDPRADNPSPDSSASGLYQFIDSTWKAFGGSTPRALQASVAEQHRVADRAFAANGTRDWEADPRSEACWRPKIGKHTSGREAPRHAAPVTARHAVPDPSEDDVYVVRRGDTLSKIAAKHDLSLRKIINDNRDVVADPDRIFPGERLRV